MSKDPAFLFYSKDWLQGTAKYFPAEKGVFIDLLSHHHQDGYLPPDKKRLAKICGLSEEEFNKIWEAIKEEFYEEDGKLYNDKLVSVMNDRGEHGEMRAIVGTFGQFMKKLHLPPDMKKRISDSFDYKDFIGIDRAKLSNCISIWISKWITNDGNEDGNEDGINNTKQKKGTKIKSNKPIVIPFNTMPKREEFGELPAEYIFSAIGVVKIIQAIAITEKTVKEFWDVFKMQNLTGHNYYPNESRVYSHFINVIKKQKFTNESNGKTSGTERTVNSLLSKDKRTKW